MGNGSRKLKREIVKLFERGKKLAGIDLEPGCPFGAVAGDKLQM